MCEALRDLMKEEIQEERQEAVDIATVAVIKSTIKTFRVDAIKAMTGWGFLKKIRSDMPQNYKRGNGAAFGPPSCSEMYFNTV